MKFTTSDERDDTITKLAVVQWLVLYLDLLYLKQKPSFENTANASIHFDS